MNALDPSAAPPAGARMSGVQELTDQHRSAIKAAADRYGAWLQRQVEYERCEVHRAGEWLRRIARGQA